MSCSLIERCSDFLPEIAPSPRWKLAKALSNNPEVNEEALRSVIQFFREGSPKSSPKNKASEKANQIALEELQVRIQRAIYYEIVSHMTRQEAKETLLKLREAKNFAQVTLLTFPALRFIRWREAEAVVNGLKLS